VTKRAYTGTDVRYFTDLTLTDGTCGVSCAPGDVVEVKGASPDAYFADVKTKPAKAAKPAPVAPVPEPDPIPDVPAADSGEASTPAQES
jgi:hypothetical protein